MPMTVVVTRDVPPRSRGFLASCMLEIAPGVYTSPQMSAGVRDRVWTVLSDWHAAENAGSVAMTWPDVDAPGGQRVLLLGEPPKDLWDVDGIILVRRELPPLAASDSLTKE
jgi:CRISPR-associated protein Cas2